MAAHPSHLPQKGHGDVSGTCSRGEACGRWLGGGKQVVLEAPHADRVAVAMGPALVWDPQEVDPVTMGMQAAYLTE